MTTRDAMQFINEQDEATPDRFIARLEFRGTDPTFVGYREAYLELVDLPPTAAVLDLGCGTGCGGARHRSARRLRGHRDGGRPEPGADRRR